MLATDCCFLPLPLPQLLSVIYKNQKIKGSSHTDGRHKPKDVLISHTIPLFLRGAVNNISRAGQAQLSSKRSRTKCRAKFSLGSKFRTSPSSTCTNTLVKNGLVTVIEKNRTNQSGTSHDSRALHEQDRIKSESDTRMCNDIFGLYFVLPVEPFVSRRLTRSFDFPQSTTRRRINSQPNQLNNKRKHANRSLSRTSSSRRPIPRRGIWPRCR